MLSFIFPTVFGELTLGMFPKGKEILSNLEKSSCPFLLPAIEALSSNNTIPGDASKVLRNRQRERERSSDREENNDEDNVGTEGEIERGGAPVQVANLNRYPFAQLSL